MWRNLSNTRELLLKNLYKMRNICELTGFSPTLLRAWERRYDFLSPDRLDGGHRVYDADDVQVLLRIKKLLDDGYSVGQAAALGREKLLSEDGRATDVDLPSVMGLAPNDLRIHRTTRYGGEGLSVSLRDLSVADVGTVVTLYEKVKSVFELWLYTEGHTERPATLASSVKALHDRDLLASVARLGSEEESSGLKRAALEDVKWGALGLILQMSPDIVKGEPEALSAVVLLARDHAKLMRNAFHDLDPTLRAADESPKAHGLAGAVKKIHQIRPQFEFLLDWDGCYSSRCLETSAVDRILYDCVRRIEKTGATSATLWVGPSGDGLLRWAFRFEGAEFPEYGQNDLATLAVSQSAGITSGAALDMGYLGSKRGWAWFHWPVFRPPAGVKVCQCEV